MPQLKHGHRARSRDPGSAALKPRRFKSAMVLIVRYQCGTIISAFALTRSPCCAGFNRCLCTVFRPVPAYNCSRQNPREGRGTNAAGGAATTVVAAMPGKAELLTGVEGLSSRPVRKSCCASEAPETHSQQPHVIADP
jgi:hypothetical protein